MIVLERNNFKVYNHTLSHHMQLKCITLVKCNCNKPAKEKVMWILKGLKKREAIDKGRRERRKDELEQICTQVLRFLA